ncbi:type II secretion system protein J [Bremerella sp.]|uniref:PulJ/GspJ family protein n=1 Tax=Bremerella sp. TaxID=2795602 RepID=UPI00391D8424
MRSRRQKGSSLVETLVIIAIGGVIATLAIKLLHQSQLKAQQAQHWLDLRTGVTRLELQLRQDLREAGEVELPNGQTLVIQKQDSSISYESKRDLVERTLTTQDSDQARREGYRLPGSHVVISQDNPGQIRVLIEANQGMPSSEEYVIEQPIGRRP